ncbi:DHA2 family efflux MFS transporter permease subunit [Sphingopyxis sp. PAMC25046]|jgi:DHA2 family multidrug resistance protein|uniref:Disulfide bond formation protein DsbA n=3 Tax=Alphaproteobacteria TaxID=28211 RepID=A0A0N7GSS2_SPHMC|nr:MULTISPECIES: MDR family MFS transporter [Sphingopyxis]KAB2912002.1 MAG: multidrug efflux MFS transporter [Dechloromonas sp.]ALH81507.1 disulfide bond formation protein DsbA [Sphingopyxis macrogoltabida]MCM3421294.1 multidrug efflux MFS transporter [Sphingopyxis alaskensis]PAL24649.1 EmrB/QacA family drug resistance transporter [Sphingopyxis sp. GW247-27LB]QCB54015.1 DHA2 family efflux MFS transporter permease subunit [Sphingopyxis sp. PAMC25046]
MTAELASNSASGTPTAERRNADITAWIAVAAGALGAMLATLDISIVNSALPVIQGEIGASGTEGTWIATAFLVAEIVVIPLSAWLERLFGLRNLLIIAVSAFTGFSILCGMATDLTTMIIGRTGQGFMGGALIPTAMTIVAKRLPPHQQPIGMALFGMTVILGPVMGPLIGGWLTENLSWHYAFFVNVPICAVLLLLLFVGLPHEEPKWEYLTDADWAGIAGLILGLGALTVLLEEGHREEWFESALIRWLALIAVIGFASLIYGQLNASKPVLKLRLLLNRQFGSVAVMALALGMVMYGSTYVIPQFLAIISDYNAFQTGLVIFWMGIPAFVLMPILPFMIRRLHIRIAVGVGMLLMAASCFVSISLTAESGGAVFIESQLIRGVGMILAMMFLNQATVASVAKTDAGDASGIFNAARNLGGSFALAGLASFQDQRIWHHSRRMEETLNANSASLQIYLDELAKSFGGMEGAMSMLGRTIQRDAFVMTYNDVFLVMGVLTLMTVPLVIFLKPLPKNVSLSMH